MTGSYTLYSSKSWYRSSRDVQGLGTDDKVSSRGRPWGSIPARRSRAALLLSYDYFSVTQMYKHLPTFRT